MAIDFLKDDVCDIAESLPALMNEVDTDYRFTSKESWYDEWPESDLEGGIASYSVLAPGCDIPSSRNDLETEFGIGVQLQVWDMPPEADDERRVQLYTGESRTTPVRKRKAESEELHQILSDDLESVMLPKPDSREHVEENGSEVYYWD